MEQRVLHFSLFPAGGVDIASSRIRVYGFQRSLDTYGVRSTFGYTRAANVLYFQKKVTRENLWQARIAKARGRIVIYDIDDLGDALWYWVPKPYFLKMLRYADVVTTCSQDQLDILAREYGVKNGRVILPAVDYFPLEPVRLKERAPGPLRIIWFGSSSNIGLLEKYLGALRQIPDAEIHAVVGHYSLSEFSEKYPSVRFLPWSVCGMITALQSCDIACLMHDGEEEDKAKGNNKMIAAITWGVPAVVSRTPEYERTAREAGVEDAVFSGVHDLPRVVERLRSPAARAQYLDTAQPAIWGRYSPDAIAQQYIRLAFALLDARSLLGRMRHLISKCVP